MVLDFYPIEDITAAFKEWMRSKSTMPTPSDILKLTEYASITRRNNSKKYYPAVAVPQRVIEKVPWYGLSWNEIEKQGFIPQIEQHLVELTKKNGKQSAQRYLNYLQTGPHNNENS